MNRKTFERVIETQRPFLLSVAANIVGEHAAPDVVQTTYMSVFHARDWRRMNAGTFTRWLVRAVQNDARNYLVARERAREHAIAFVESAQPAESEPALDDVIEVRRAVESLPPEVGAAIVACVVRGKTLREHGIETGISHDTVRRLYLHGISLLRGHLTKLPAARLYRGKDENPEARLGRGRLEHPLTAASAAFLRTWARQVRGMYERGRRLPLLLQPLVASYARWYASLPSEARTSERRRHRLTEDDLLGRL